MPDIDNQITFNLLLASSIHDIKNSLGLVINSLDILDDKDSAVAPDQIPLLQFEARRINENLIQLLTLYKSENNLLFINTTEHNIHEFLDEIIVREYKIAEAKGIQLSISCDSQLTGYFDSELITGVLRNAIHNAMRHTSDYIRITASNDDDKSLQIQVIDNGPGFNKSAIAWVNQNIGNIDYDNGSTGVGLHFSKIVSNLHSNRDKNGFISLANKENSNGAIFSLHLP